MSDFYSASVAVGASGPAVKLVDSANVDRVFLSPAILGTSAVMVGYNSTDLYLLFAEAQISASGAGGIAGILIPAGEEFWAIHTGGGGTITVNFMLTSATKQVGIGITTC